MNLRLFNTHISKDAYKNVKKVLDSTFLSEGKLVEKFENLISKKFGILNPVAVNSGTSALHLALILENIKEGDEVILPAQTFVATGMVILQTGAKPVFADIDYDTGNISPESIKKKITSNTKAIIVVHWGGYPCDMEEILIIAKKHKIIVIEDAAHAFGATYKKKSIGSIADYTCFSFQSIKHITTGDGGAICCKNKNKFHKAKQLRWFGIDRNKAKLSILGERKYDISEIGYKYHMNDYAAALGIANLNNFKSRLKYRKLIAQKYRKELCNIPEIKLFENKNDRTNAYWLFGMHVKNRIKLITFLKKKGITASVVHLGINHNSVFGKKENNLVSQKTFNKTQIHIPIHEQLKIKDVEHITSSIKEFYKNQHNS